MPLSAVFFDLDGTLVNTLPLFRQAVGQILNGQGIAIDEEFFHEWQGRRGSWSSLLERHGIDPHHGKPLEQAAMSHFDELLRTQSDWMPGAEALLENLKQREIPMALVTNAFERFVRPVVDALRMSRWMSVIITSEDMGGKLKPDPYGLILAARRLGHNPQHIIYIGDQYVDVVAANAAGMRSWLIQGPHIPTEKNDSAERILRSLDEACDAL